MGSDGKEQKPVGQTDEEKHSKQKGIAHNKSKGIEALW